MKQLAVLPALALSAVPSSFCQSVPEQVDAIIEKHHGENLEIGISVGLIWKGEEFYTAYGKVSRVSDVDINKNSVFEIASITKALTGNLVAQAALGGKLKLSDYVDGYLPEDFVLQPALKNKVRISDLASHQSGLPDLDFGALIAEDPQQPTKSVTKGTLVEIVNGAKELSDYGSYRYSTMGYALLGQVLEGVHGKPYDQIVTDELLVPLRLPGTYTKDFSRAYRTVGHNPEGGVQEFFEWNVTAPAGLIKSCAADMVTYLRAVLDERSPVGRASMEGEKVLYSQGGREIGLGLAIVEDGEDVLFLKSGDSLGQSSMLCYSRTGDWGVVILLNRRASTLRETILNDIYASVLKM